MASLRKLVHALTLLIVISDLTAAPTNAAQDNLIEASSAGDLSQVLQALLAAKADVNAKTNAADTALIAAVTFDNLEVVQALLAANADVNAKGGIGLTPLMIAFQSPLGLTLLIVIEKATGSRERS